MKRPFFDACKEQLVSYYNPRSDGLRLTGAKSVRRDCQTHASKISGIYMKYTQTTLDKAEKILEEAGYVVRYERGTFQSGYCILEQRKVVVLNKFLQTEGRINTLLEIIPQLNIQTEVLTADSRKLYEAIRLRSEV